MSLVMARSTETTEPRGVKVSVILNEADYLRLETLKLRRRVSTGKSVSNQELLSTWITEQLDAAEKAGELHS
jgi:hypothetical protein